MHSSLTAVVLCLFVQAAAAECVTTAPLAREARQGAEMVKASNLPAAAAPRPGGELIKTAAAGTRDAPGAARAGVARAAQRMPADEEHPPRSGTAMLLAALALMSGIALRRYGASKQ
jgi:hypothetical protein